jgi:hemerythrin superfamily protein
MSTVSEVITKDHREIEQYYNEVVNSTDHDHQTRYGNQFTWELARHSIGEELIVYPAFEKYLGAAGKEKADKDRKEHHEVS